jgi:cyanate permease
VRKPFLLAPGAILGLAGIGSFLFQNEAVIYSSVIVFGFFTFLYLPVLLTIPMELEGLSESQVSVAWATMLAVASGIAIIGPITVGFLTDSFGSFVPGFMLWAVLSSGLLLVGMMVPETGPRARLARTKG